MKKLIYSAALAVAGLMAIGTTYNVADTACIVFPQNGRDIFGLAQRNIYVIDGNRVSFIPQLNFEGDAEDFGILVPVPSLPELSTVNAQVFSEASFLTQPLVRSSGQGCGCDDDSNVFLAFPDEARFSAEDGAIVADDGVNIIFEEVVGAYNATVLQANNPGALTVWLQENGYQYELADSSVLAEYVQDNWFFVAMQLDPSQVPQFVDRWWSATTSPAKISFTYDQAELRYPLKATSISTGEKAEVLIYTISDKPMRFDGAEVEYANEIDGAEADIIAGRYPGLYDFISTGSFVTKLRKDFRRSEMDQDFMISPSEDRREFREIVYIDNAGFQLSGLILLVLLIKLRRRFFAGEVNRDAGKSV